MVLTAPCTPPHASRRPVALTLAFVCLLAFTSGCESNASSSQGTSGTGNVANGDGEPEGNSDVTDQRFVGVDWQCSKLEDWCSCCGIPPDADEMCGVGFGPTEEVEVLECGGGYSCCINTQTADGTFNCRCLATANCDAEASSRKNTEVVATCPPVPRTDCAIQAENCSGGYLYDMGYEGCCSGLTCATGSDGVEQCQ